MPGFSDFFCANFIQIIIFRVSNAVLFLSALALQWVSPLIPIYFSPEGLLRILLRLLYDEYITNPGTVCSAVITSGY